MTCAPLLAKRVLGAVRRNALKRVERHPLGVQVRHEQNNVRRPQRVPRRVDRHLARPVLKRCKLEELAVFRQLGHDCASLACPGVPPAREQPQGEWAVLDRGLARQDVR